MHALAFIAGLIALTGAAFGKRTAILLGQAIVIAIGCAFAVGCLVFGYVLFRVVTGTI